MLNIPANRPRIRALMLPILLGLTVLLFTLVLMPLQGSDEQPEASAQP